MSEKRIFRGYTPKAWQQVVHDAITNTTDDAGKIFVVKSPRQIGKSFLIEMELLRHAINNNNSVNICVSITFSNCKKILVKVSTFMKLNLMVFQPNALGNLAMIFC